MKNFACYLLLFIPILLTNLAKSSTFYWVGGTGNWSDYANHWATSSGGSTFHVHPPTLLDDVIFEDVSFLTSNDTVYLDQSPLACKNLDWSAVTGNQSFYTSSSVTLRVYGSCLLSPTMIWHMDGLLEFRSPNLGNIVDFSNQVMSIAGASLDEFYTDVSFVDTGSWDIVSNVFLFDTAGLSNTSIGGSFRIYKGHVETNGYSIICYNLLTTLDSTIVFNLDTSMVYCTSNYQDSPPSIGAFITGDNARIYCNDFKGNNKYKFVDCITCEVDSTIDNLVCRVSLDGNNYEIGNCLMFGERIYGQGYIKSLYSIRNLTFYSSIVTDTIRFASPGQIIEIKNGLTVSVNDHLNIASSSGLFTTIQCLNGTGMLTVSGDTVCTDNLFVQNINSANSTALFAGDHGLDLGGNTGWSFSSCTPSFSNVWPGDVNYDLITDINDILYIGIALGDTGTTRPNASLNYVAQPALDWSAQFGNGVNVKHADCDGNGIVELADTTAVSQNYGLTHPFKLASSISSFWLDPVLYLSYPENLIPGSTVNVPIMLGSNRIQAFYLHGLTFSIDYDPSQIVQGSFSISIDTSWLADPLTGFTFIKDLTSINRLDACISRIDRIDENGKGRIGTLHFTLTTGASGLFQLGLKDAYGINHTGAPIPIRSNVSSGIITSVGEINSGNQLSSIYPNPVTQNAKIKFQNLYQSKCTLLISDIHSRIIRKSITTSDYFLFEKENFSPGLYIYQILSEENSNIGTGKIIVSH